MSIVHTIEECPGCQGYGGWEYPTPDAIRWNIDPPTLEWVQCNQCQGEGQIPVVKELQHERDSSNKRR